MKIKIKQANFLEDEKDIIFLLNGYANDPMGGSEQLSKFVVDNLCKELAKNPNALSLLAYVDNKPAGLMNCFEGFSTFKCKPIMYIHDLFVDKNFRGYGLSTKLLITIEDIANQRNCCKLTLEVLEKNEIAINSYKKFGFSNYQLNPELGNAEFWEKKL